MAYIRASQGGGGGYSGYTLVNELQTAAPGQVVSGLDTSKKYLILIYNITTGSNNYNINAFDNVTISTGSGTLTKKSNFTNASSKGAGTVYLLEPTSSSITITSPTSLGFKVQVFLAE